MTEYEKQGVMFHTMNAREQETRYRLLKILSQESNLSQRDMAKQMGISLGKVNYCVSDLAKRGLIDVIRFKSAKNKIPYTYILTPQGIKEKVRLTASFLKRKIAEYEEMRVQIAHLLLELEEERKNKSSETKPEKTPSLARWQAF